jgi:hypothetical protein
MRCNQPSFRHEKHDAAETESYGEQPEPLVHEYFLKINISVKVFIRPSRKNLRPDILQGFDEFMPITGRQPVRSFQFLSTAEISARHADSQRFLLYNAACLLRSQK